MQFYRNVVRVLTCLALLVFCSHGSEPDNVGSEGILESFANPSEVLAIDAPLVVDTIESSNAQRASPEAPCISLVLPPSQSEASLDCSPLAVSLLQLDEDKERYIIVFQSTTSEQKSISIEAKIISLFESVSSLRKSTEKVPYRIHSRFSFGGAMTGISVDLSHSMVLVETANEGEVVSGLANLQKLLEPLKESILMIEKSEKVYPTGQIDIPESFKESREESPKDSASKILGTQYGAPWNLIRLSQRPSLVSSVASFSELLTSIESKAYFYESDGQNVDIFIIDSGLASSHPEFEGRAMTVVDFTGEQPSWTDTFGHGTHVAGIIGSKTYGVCKKATLKAVRVIGTKGSSDWATVISALNWIYTKGLSSTRKAVINMSIGGPISNAMDLALKALLDKGVAMIVAAGNDASSACQYSPASSTSVITVGSSSFGDTYYSTSNYGACVDVVAPGQFIRSTYIPEGVQWMTGTSMAAPHVTGVLVLLWSSYPWLSLQQLQSYVFAHASANLLLNLPTFDTPNKLVFSLVNG